VNGIDDSRATVKIAKGGELQIADLMIPIESSVTIEVISVTPVDQKLYCVHAEFKTVRRNYGWWPRSREFLISGPIFVMLPTLLLYSIARLIFGKEHADVYFISISDGLRSLGFPELLSGIIAGFHVSLIVFVVAYLYQFRLRASAAEKRFTKLKI
jgi:hypothetical protein